jgi:hypothetical protein
MQLILRGIDKKIWYAILLLQSVLYFSCQKVDVNFINAQFGDDPNITYLDKYPVNISTYKPDSFITSNHQVMCMGYHKDPVFGTIRASSYFQLNLPATNPVADKTVAFDSICLVLKRNGNIYGDSTKNITYNIFELSQNISTGTSSNYYYNVSHFGYNSVPMTTKTLNLAGNNQEISMRLPDTMGQNWLELFRTKDDKVSTQDQFTNYFKGFYVSTDSINTQSISYYSLPSDSAVVRLYYRELGLAPVSKSITFTYTDSKQFSNITGSFDKSNLSAFIPNKGQLISSASSGNQSYFNTNLGTSIKISFPTLLNLKELHPYINVLKAELVIKPDISSYTSPYSLPPTLHLYITDTTNALIAGLYVPNATQQAFQNGNLVVDGLYNENTSYTYDVTSFINSKLSAGSFSTEALLLSTSQTYYESGIQRLLLNDLTKTNKSVQLKMYVLGL